MEQFTTKPNPDQPDRCPSIDPHDTLQCGRRIHGDDQCQFGGIAWRKGTPRYVSDAERVVELTARLAAVEAYRRRCGMLRVEPTSRGLYDALQPAPVDATRGQG
jgi:hypothetical protein